MRLGEVASEVPKERVERKVGCSRGDAGEE